MFIGECRLLQFSVSYGDGQHGAITGTATADYSTAYSDTLVPDKGYVLPNALTATMGGAPFTDFTYSKDSGTIAIAAGVILGDIVLEGVCPPSSVQAPVITTQPTDIAVDYGYTEQKASVAATAQEWCALTYQWYENSSDTSTEGALVAGETDAELHIPDGKAVGTYYYYCVVTATHSDGNDSNSTASDTMTFTVGQIMPVFTVQPEDAVAVDSTQAVFTVAVTGQPAPTLQWEVSKDEGATWQNATGTGATTNEYTTAAVTPSNNGYQYRCVATALEQVIYSAVVTLTVERNRVTGLRANAQIARGETVAFTAVGAGMDNRSPEDGDVRFEPVDWQINPSGTFAAGGPYAASFSTEKMKLGHHVLTVRYQRQIYDAAKGMWCNDEGVLSSVRVPEKVVSSEIPLTGDNTPVVFLLGLTLASGGLLVARLRKRKRKQA